MNTESILLRQRAQIKQLEKAVINHSKCSKKNRTASYLTARLENLEPLFIEISKLHTILIVAPSDEVDDYIDNDEFETAEETFLTFKANLRDGILALQPPLAPVVNMIQPNALANENVAPLNDFRLPTISIPTFNGDYNAWPSFKNSFNHLVANNHTLSDLQRLHYLKNSVTGDARKLINHYDIDEANYKAAWDKLVLRYDNKNFLISIHLKSLLHQPAQSKETASNLRSLIDTFTDSLNGLRTLGVSTEGWDPIIIHLFIEKISTETHSLWQASQMTNNELPKLTDLLTFLENRFRTLEAIAEKPARSHFNPFDSTSNAKNTQRAPKQAHSFTASLNYECFLCKGNHYLRACPSFLRMEPKERLKTAQNNKVCINCLVSGHTVNQCRNKTNCTLCNKRHHTLLHFPQNFNNTNPAGSSTSTANALTVSTRSLQLPSESNNAMHTSTPISNPVLLATARINVANNCGQLLSLRALIDPGSQVSFVTNKAIQQLNLKPSSTNAKIFGIGQTFSGTSTKTISLTFQSITDSDTKIKSDFLTIPQITGCLPQLSNDDMQWSHIRNLQLADPLYNRSGPIDILLSAEIYGQIILPGIQRGQIDEPIAQNTTMGWILLGGSPTSYSTTNLSLHTLVDLDSRLRSFWETEEISTNSKPVSPEDEESEIHYKETFTRDPNGRYVVRLPFKSGFSQTIGSSRDNAIKRFLQIESKFIKNPQLAKDYRAFMNEYEELNHMKQDVEIPEAYYIPHHPVIKTSSSTTKLRVVFDASHKSRSGYSLNDYLRVGPTIQDDLTTLINRWRKYPLAFTADLEKMYRQIRVNEQDQRFQRIVWRNSPDEPIQDFKLLTVTYGTACAQYLAIRSLHQLAFDGVESHPLASNRILEGFYVDDLLSGAYDLPEALKIQKQLRDLTATAGLNLRKWASNHNALLHSIPPEDREIKSNLLIDFDDTVKSLGIHWNPVTDEFTFQSSLDSSHTSTTKRSILSEISRLFDPMGWLSPIIIKPKILMQQMWILAAGWDEELPPTILNKWQSIREDLRSVHLFSIPRSINHSLNAPIELHGFSDASIHAYAAVVYSRILKADKTYAVTLLAAKSRVAPIKQITLPRLELCGAHLLSKLMRKVVTDIKVSDVKAYAWCDSTIVLQWMQGHPNRLKTFVANRVSEILEYGNIQKWRHVSSKDNPADCASRGIDASSLKSHHIWWNGPSWLRLEESLWPLSIPPALEALPDVKSITLKATLESDDFELFVTSYSSVTRLTRITAHLKRFIYNVQNPKGHLIGPLTHQELQKSLTNIIQRIQTTAFYMDYNTLQAKHKLHRRSQLLSLNPFLDDQKLLRVGGRLQNSNMPFEARHPLILPKGNHLTKLLIRQAHLNTLHGGPELVISMLRRRFWILCMRSAVRQEIHLCVKCFRFNTTRCTQLMGSLPKPRVTVDRPFNHTGVDCAGPIYVRMSKGRGAKSFKAYIVLFICLGTKAVHIEVVSDLSTPSFIAAYRRFCSRRGCPQRMYSDNGTNFVGASKVLRKEACGQLLGVSEDLINEITNNGSEWHFIPPLAPHFGGLWEAGIKSIKYHLKRIIGESTLTFEEISTLLYQIEACLNSRPLCPTTSDPSDNTALTPGHFLVGDALIAPPENSPIIGNIHTRWQLVQKLKNDFWRRWQKEYITRLQNRPKWASISSNVKLNDLVIIKDDNLPPSRWALGRIVDTHPGADELVRVVTIKCQTGLIKRPISKIALLPTSN